MKPWWKCNAEWPCGWTGYLPIVEHLLGDKFLTFRCPKCLYTISRNEP